MTLSNLGTIEMMKENYLSQVGSSKVSQTNVDITKLRFFCMGKELKNELFLYSYDMIDNMVVQAMIRQ